VNDGIATQNQPSLPETYFANMNTIKNILTVIVIIALSPFTLIGILFQLILGGLDLGRTIVSNVAEWMMKE
jgi:hypothetical protein